MSLDSIEVFDHAHTVLSSVSLIQMVQSGARIVVTFKTVLNNATNKYLAALDTTRYTGY